MDGLQRLLEFADYLRSQRMQFLIWQDRADAVTLSFGTFGNRFSLDFHEEHVACRRYGGTERLSTDLAAVMDMVGGRVSAAGAALERRERDLLPVVPASQAGGMRRLLGFTANLRENGIHHSIEQHSPEALEVSFTAEGIRVEVEFSVDGAMYSEFEGQATELFDEAAVRREVEVFTRPFAPARRMRKEREHAAE
jgi:hypothetical protein